MAQIIIRRGRQYFGMFRQLEIFLDGAKVGGVPYDQQRSFSIGGGRHDLLVKMDWCVSQPFTFVIKDDGVTEFECGCRFGPLMAFLSISLHSHDFFYIKAISLMEQDEGVWPPAPNTGGTS
jgi:hypothetical protein